VRRECKYISPQVKICSLPAEWQEFHSGFSGDFQCFKIDVSGRRYGASWRGRIVIYADKPYEVGDVVRIREMEAVHKVKAVYTEKATIYGGTVTLRKEVPLSSKEGVEELARRPYLVFEDASSDEPQAFLVWAEARTKTTLKGFGRQYRASIIDKSLKSWDIYGGYRSGRAYTEAVLAIVDSEHPVIVQSRGDVEFTRKYAGCVAEEI